MGKQERSGITTGQRRDYRPIRDYGLIGDTATAALIASDGSIDWCCWPRFDSPAVFCRLLDANQGGWFKVGPAGPSTATRRYVGATNVLATTFTTSSGQFRVTDLMPVSERQAGSGQQGSSPRQRILRLVEGLAGEAELEVSFRPTFDYARAATTVHPWAGGILAQDDHQSLALACPIDLQPDGTGTLVGRGKIAAGDRFWIALDYRPGTEASPTLPESAALDSDLAVTLNYWERWSARCTYAGPYYALVQRSALALELLTYTPTGALVAAPTTSLPEELGGVRNWDYRYTWLRDSALTLYALHTTGYHEEASQFFDWLDELCIACRPDLQIMYRITGSPDLPERTLTHLEGYRGSRPVRTGNAAARQDQLDMYGQVLDTAYVCDELIHPVRPELWEVLRYFADEAARRWQQPDHGIWEIRAEPRHFLYSKLYCWVALDRAIRVAEREGLPGDGVRWRRTREQIRHVILTQGYDNEVGAFTQVLGQPALDASALVIPLVGFLPASDPRVRSTVERVRERLTSHGLVYRYLTGDGLPGGEGTFALCSFWLVDNLALSERVDEARVLFERIASYANDLGLLSEEIAPLNGELLGNYPQGFTHLALIRSAQTIAQTEKPDARGGQD